MKSSEVVPPSFLEYLTGIISILVFVSQIFYKFNSKQLIFLFNPCHVVNITQGILLLSKNTKFYRILYTLMMNNIFCPYIINYPRWIAIIFPITDGLDAPLEVELFWIEHYMAAIINPVIITVAGR